MYRTKGPDQSVWRRYESRNRSCCFSILAPEGTNDMAESGFHIYNEPVWLCWAQYNVLWQAWSCRGRSAASVWWCPRCRPRARSSARDPGGAASSCRLIRQSTEQTPPRPPVGKWRYLQNIIEVVSFYHNFLLKVNEAGSFQKCVYSLFLIYNGEV